MGIEVCPRAAFQFSTMPYILYDKKIILESIILFVPCFYLDRINRVYYQNVHG
jgi:hypothetical protein